MHPDGVYFRAYLDQNKVNKLQLARDLGMSQPNLYGLFKSKKFEADTIRNIERTLKIKWSEIIKTNVSTNVIQEGEADDIIGNNIMGLLEDRNRAMNVIERLTAVLEKKYGIISAPPVSAPMENLRAKQRKANSEKH